MAFCSKCGKELAEGAQFCASCGAPVNGAAENDGTKRVQKFVGEIRKCPSCGAVLESFQARCPSCGHELTNVKANNAINVFFEEYGKEYNVDVKISKIKAFPIPNTKEDLFEFAILADSQMKAYLDWKDENGGFLKQRLQLNEMLTTSMLTFGKGSGKATEDLITEKKSERNEKKIYYAWVSKFDQICAKANLVFESGSNDLQQILSMREQINSRIQKSKKKTMLKIAIPVLIFVGFYVILFTWLGVYDSKDKKVEAKETQRLEQLYEEIKSDISAGNYEDAELKFLDLKWTYESDYSSQKDNVEKWNEKKEALQKLLEKKAEGERNKK